jgi:ankyrin repeat protein
MPSPQVLVREGADIQLCDAQGRSALHWATKLARPDCLSLLLENSFKSIIVKRDEESLTALHWAVMCDHREHVEVRDSERGVWMEL